MNTVKYYRMLPTGEYHLKKVRTQRRLRDYYKDQTPSTRMSVAHADIFMKRQGYLRQRPPKGTPIIDGGYA